MKIDPQEHEAFGDALTVEALRAEEAAAEQAPGGQQPKWHATPFAYGAFGSGYFDGRRIAAPQTIGHDMVWWRLALACEHTLGHLASASFHRAQSAFGEHMFCESCRGEQRIVAAVPLRRIVGR